MSEDITHFIFHTWQFLLSVVGVRILYALKACHL